MASLTSQVRQLKQQSPGKLKQHRGNRVTDSHIVSKALSVQEVKGTTVSGANFYGGNFYGNGEVLSAITGHVSIFPPQYSSIGQGTFVAAHDGNVCGGCSFYNSSNADGDNITYKVYLSAGTYKFFFQSSDLGSRGIVDVTLDDTEITSVDMYQGSAKYSNRHTADVTITESKIYDLTFTIDGKNGSSSGYQIALGAIAFWRTG